MYPFGIHTGLGIYVTLWDTPRRFWGPFWAAGMCPFGIRGVTLWGTGFCFFGIIEQHSVPSLKVARRCDVSAFGVERRTFGYSPMWRDAMALNTQAPPSRHNNEAVMVKFAEPPLHRS
jgi:hypothetical protein